LQMDGVCVRYDKQSELVLRDVSLDVEHKNFISVLGRSGIGKTTALRAIAGFEAIQKGYIRINGQLVSSSFVCRPPEKRDVGVVFQDYALFPNKTVKQNVEFGLPNSKNADESRRRLAAVMDLTGIVGLERRRPGELSGGEQQRVAVARALVRQPRVLLMDEPFSNVDADSKVKMRSELKRIVDEAEITTVMVTHNREDALALSDKIAVMCDGVIKQYGACEEVYRFPCSYDVANICGPCNFVDGTYKGGAALTAAGRFELAAQLRSEFSDGDKLALLIRPTDVDILPCRADAGVKIVYRKFRGHMQEYGVELPTGELIRVYKLNSLQLDADDTLSVSISPRAGAAFMAFKRPL